MPERARPRPGGNRRRQESGATAAADAAAVLRRLGGRRISVERKLGKRARVTLGYRLRRLERLTRTRLPQGTGIRGLFAGPSGTGKTMAAEVLAESLGMEIYRIDLAGVVSKYVGETEKNLIGVLDACEQAGVILFFDEADALFGKRTRVVDARALLARIAEYSGVLVFATNRSADLDEALLRRMDVTISLPT